MSYTCIHLTGTYFPMVDSTVSNYGPRPLKLTGRHGHFLDSTCDIRRSDMGHVGFKIVVTWDIAFSYIRHVTLQGAHAFLRTQNKNFIRPL